MAKKDKGIFEEHEQQEAQHEVQPETAEEAERPESNFFNEGDEQNAQLELELAQTKESLLRSLADIENLKRRTEKEVEDAHKYAAKNFAIDLLEVYENFERALANIEDKDLEGNDKFKSLHEGVSLTKKTLESAFAKNGVVRIAPEANEDFNHDYHQALQQVPAPEVENGKVAFTVQAGYTLNGRLLRPALVNIAKN